MKPTLSISNAEKALSEIIKTVELANLFNSKQDECIKILHKYFVSLGIENGCNISRTNRSLDQALNSGNGTYKP